MKNPSFSSGREAPRSALVSDVIYELLDAHHDTAQLADELTVDARWRAHLQYLADLQRVGREALAQLPTEQVG